METVTCHMRDMLKSAGKPTAFNNPSAMVRAVTIGKISGVKDCTPVWLPKDHAFDRIADIIEASDMALLMIEKGVQI